MADPLLIAPDNRLFGWALNDLTLYGGQPLPAVTVARAPEDEATSLTPPATPADGQPAPPESDVAARETTALLDSSATPTEFPAGTAPAAPTQTPAVAPSTTVDAPAPSLGSSGFVPAIALTSLQPAQPEAGATAATAPAAQSATVAPVAQTIVPIEPPADLASPGPTTLAAQQVAVGDIAATVANALATAATTTAALPATVIAATDQASAALDSLPLESFGGVDPAAGLTTLVGLVESSEGFDIVEATAPLPDVAQSSILDALAADAAPSPLLGEVPGGLDDALDDPRIDLGL